jgi:hypothetical protein
MWRYLWRFRIPSVMALILGFVLLVNADRLAGPKLPDGSRDDRSFVIHTAASAGGTLICLFALAEMLHATWRGRRKPTAPGTSIDR